MESMDVQMLLDPHPSGSLPTSSGGNGPELHKPPAEEVKMNIEKNWRTLCEAANNAIEFKKVLEEVSMKANVDQTVILNFSGPSDDALIHVAAKHGSADIVKLILEKVPCLLRKKGIDGDTVWHIAAKTGKVFDQLFELRNEFKNSLEGHRYGMNNVEVTRVDLCLRDVNEEGNTALHEALINGCKRMAETLVEVDLGLSIYVNEKKKSALYLTIEAGYDDIVQNILEKATTGSMCQKNGKLKLKGKSIVHAAIMRKNIAALALIWNCEAKLIESREEEGRELHCFLTRTKDEEGMNPLHWAASIGFLEGITYLLLDKKIPMFKDRKKLEPIHWASMKGHVEVVKELLQYHKNLNNLVSCDGHNVLHLAAKNGRHNVVSHFLQIHKTPELESLMNKGDAQWNTPLHLATVQWHPKVVSALTWDNRVDLKLTNGEGLTALDAALLNIKGIGSFRQWLTWQVLKAAGAPRATSDKVLNAKRTASMKLKPINTVNYINIVRVLLVVSIVIASVSFETSSTKLAYGNNFDTHMGITTSIPQIKNYIFILCNYVSMFTSIVVIAVLIGAHFGDVNMAFAALRFAKPLVAMALTMTTLALMPGVQPVGRKYYWLVDAVLTIIMASLVSLAMLFFPVCFPLPPGYQILRYITYCPISLMILHFGDHLEE